MFARCVKQDGFYTVVIFFSLSILFARCVKQDGFYTNISRLNRNFSLLGVLNKMGSILTTFNILTRGVC